VIVAPEASVVTAVTPSGPLLVITVPVTSTLLKFIAPVVSAELVRIALTPDSIAAITADDDESVDEVAVDLDPDESVLPVSVDLVPEEDESVLPVPLVFVLVPAEDESVPVVPPAAVFVSSSSSSSSSESVPEEDESVLPVPLDLVPEEDESVLPVPLDFELVPAEEESVPVVPPAELLPAKVSKGNNTNKINVDNKAISLLKILCF